MSLICLVMINTESNLTLNFNGSVLIGATQRGKEEAQNILGEGGLGWPRHSRLSTCSVPPLPPSMCFLGDWQRENHPGVAVPGDGGL